MSEFPEFTFDAIKNRDIQIQNFLQKNYIKGEMIGRQLTSLMVKFGEEFHIPSPTIKGVLNLVRKFDRVKNENDLIVLCQFTLTLSDMFKDGFTDQTHMVYLADQNKDFKEFLHSFLNNAFFWRKIYGNKMFSTSHETEHSKEGIWRSELPLKDYYLSLSAGSGSGTFSCDIAIGYDPKMATNQLRGQIWRAGYDTEIKDGHMQFRIIRTGSGQKKLSTNSGQELSDEQKLIRKIFLDTYKTSPQQLLHLIALEIAYDLHFSRIKALSTQGAMDLSLLSRSKSPHDYTASMISSGFSLHPNDKNWLRLDNLQEDFYEVLVRNGHDGALLPQMVRGYDMIYTAYNSLKHNDGSDLPHKIDFGDKEERERALAAFKKLHGAKKRKY